MVNKRNTRSQQLGGMIRPQSPKGTWEHDDHEEQKTMVIKRNDKTMMTKKNTKPWWQGQIKYHGDKEKLQNHGD
jgi:hypothetical protein